MNKKALIVSLLLVACVMLFADVTGTVAEVDKYGNVHTAIPEADFLAEGYELGDILLIQMEDQSVQAPFVTTYGDVDRGNPLVRLSGGYVAMALNYANFAKTYSLEEGSPVSFELVEKGTYLEELEIRNLVRTDVREDYDSDAIFANFREVTMGQIGAKKLYRSCHPSIDDPRAPYANLLVEEAGIKTVVNLSDSDEELSEFLTYSDYYASIKASGNMINLNMGVDLLSDEFAQKLKKGLLFMIETESPYLIHCVEGKDRAGMTVALLGAIMGATVDEIYEDYVISYENYYNVEKGTKAYEAVENIIRGIFKSINGGREVTDDNVGLVALKYLMEKAGMTYPQILALEAKLR